MTENPLLTAKFDDLAHGQKVAWVIERLDDLKLLFHLVRDVRRYPAVIALMGALESELAQPIRGCRSVGHIFRGIAVTDFSQRKPAAVGNLLRANDGRQIVGKKSSKNIGRVERMLCVGLEPPAASSDGNTISDSGQDILQRPAGWRVI